jgi:predicted nucleic-acid-binding Zn-ribbon protein
MDKVEYQKYLASDEWKQKRSRKWERSNKRCSICGSTKKIDIHHLNYKNLFDVTNNDLRLLCRRCHYLAHDLMKQGKIKLKITDVPNKKYQTIKNKVRNYLGLDDERHERKNAKIRMRKALSIVKT